MDKCPVCGNDEEVFFTDYRTGSHERDMEVCLKCGVMQTVESRQKELLKEAKVREYRRKLEEEN